MANPTYIDHISYIDEPGGWRERGGMALRAQGGLRTTLAWGLPGYVPSVAHGAEDTLKPVAVKRAGGSLVPASVKRPGNGVEAPGVAEGA